VGAHDGQGFANADVKRLVAKIVRRMRAAKRHVAVDDRLEFRA
jgi:hypothetical protein